MIDEVAEAIRYSYAEVVFGNNEAFRRLAQAAIDCFPREYKHLEDGWGGQTIHADGTVTSEGKAATRMSRLVGPWEVDKP